MPVTRHCIRHARRGNRHERRCRPARRRRSAVDRRVRARPHSGTHSPRPGTRQGARQTGRRTAHRRATPRCAVQNHDSGGGRSTASIKETANNAMRWFHRLPVVVAMSLPLFFSSQLKTPPSRVRPGEIRTRDHPPTRAWDQSRPACYGWQRQERAATRTFDTRSANEPD